MSLSHALLGLLNRRPATGYELKSEFQRSAHLFWDATLSQIYRTLHEMRARGWLVSNVEHQESKPSRRVYVITESGRAVFLSWLLRWEEMPRERHLMLMKVFFGNQIGPEQLSGQLKRWREYQVLVLNRCEEEIRSAGGVGGHQGPESAYQRFTLEYGKCLAQTIVEWCDRTIEELGEGDAAARARRTDAGHDPDNGG
ncbi:MAG: Transcriptional regulator PadR-like family protein [Syntrophorhabdus sp. PtaB.Bin184]|nr:MAG: Transcriptional regulator PadR-like family protein [Syntrophorhabdus sp. PtaB.Bin184]